MGFRQVVRSEPTFDAWTIPADYDWMTVGKNYYGGQANPQLEAQAAWDRFCKIMAGGRWLVHHALEPGFRECNGWGTYGYIPSVGLIGIFENGFYDWVGIYEIKPLREAAL